ncbi:AI-2E family transporter [Actimicrobium sp. CCI2.3]|nr:AI-2E family transporter [Actimicrobium sp. CCI2.3]MDY7574938.1 AI-2E family transporter [Actimicrobium sp. CCI2.3]MEB0021491.1 AI-2E family transporter [Actimicrobium sp. CCI2.3]
MPERVHVDVRGLSLTIIAVVATLFALQMAQKFLIPLVCGIFLTYTLNPVVGWLERCRIARLFGTVLVMLALTASITVVTTSLADEFQSIVKTLPEASHKVARAVLRYRSGQPSALQRMQAAAAEIEAATSGARSNPSTLSSESPTVRVSDLLLAGSRSAIVLVGEAIVVLFLVFFLLLSGDTFKRKLVKLTGPSFSRKKITVHILDDINSSIQKYMSMLLVTNSLLAVLMWICFRLIGLENAGAWAVAAGLLHVIPYFGPLLVTVAVGLMAFLQFGTLTPVLLVIGSSLGVSSLVGTLVTTWMTGRIAKMNPAAVFIALLFWGWLWGVWGMLLGVPVVVIIRVVAEHVDGMQVVAELLGE